MTDMAVTKLDMARVIVLALYNLKALPAGDDVRVVQQMKHRKDTLARKHKMALAAIASVKSA